jgi:hypothetical protein
LDDWYTFQSLFLVHYYIAADSYGFAKRPGKGSHHFYWRGEYRLVIPYRRPHILPAYVKLALEVLERLEREENHD